MAITITPQKILEDFSNRLKSKNKDLEFLACMNKQFEKWFQCELVLTFDKKTLPAIYDDNYDEIKTEKYGEQISDITIEYKMDKKRIIDVCIAERPFLLKFANKKTWKIKNTKDIERCISAYNNAKYHFVELKYHRWVTKTGYYRVAKSMITDLNKYKDKKRVAEHGAKSIISICCVAFWDKKRLNKKVILQIIDKIKGDVKEKMPKIDFDSKQIYNGYYLLMAYF